MRYKILVLPEGEPEATEETTYTIESVKPIDGKLLQIVGLILDGGWSTEEVEEHWPQAAMYVEIETCGTA